MLLPVLCRRWWEWRSWSVLSRLVAVGWCIDAWTPLKAHSPWSACTPQYCPPLLTQKMSSTRILQQQSWPSPAREQLVLLGHFSARVGADNDSWPSRLGPFGVGIMNWNGQRLLKLYCVPFRPFASLTPSSTQNLSTKSSGDTRVQGTGTNWPDSG